MYVFCSVSTVRHKAKSRSVEHAVVEPYPAPPPELSQERPKSVRRLRRAVSSFSAARAGCVAEAGRSGRRHLNSLSAVCRVLSMLSTVVVELSTSNTLSSFYLQAILVPQRRQLSYTQQYLSKGYDSYHSGVVFLVVSCDCALGSHMPPCGAGAGR